MIPLTVSTWYLISMYEPVGKRPLKMLRSNSKFPDAFTSMPRSLTVAKLASLASMNPLLETAQLIVSEFVKRELLVD